MVVLIADALADSARESISNAGHTILYEPTLTGDALTEALRQRDPAILVVRSTKVTETDLAASPGLELIVRAGAGVDSIDVAAASRRGVFVANCPGKNATAVAELAFGLLLALDRRIPDNVQEARAGQWNKKGFARGRGLYGQTLGLIGLGSIGREMVTRAKAFGMPVVAWSRSLTAEDARQLGVERASSPLDVARRADVVSLHVASTPATRGLVNAEFLNEMQDGAALINTARADIVDEGAVADAIASRGLRYATDVPAGEPQAKACDFEHPLAESSYITHHIGASTDQATEAIGEEAARVVVTYAETGEVENSINIAEQTPATHLLTVRHLDRVGVLAGVLDEVRQANWNVHEMENVVFEGAEAACARIRFDGEPDEGVLARIGDHVHVLNATVIQLEEAPGA